MTKTHQWYYDGVAIGGATAKTHTLTSGQTDSDRIECRVQVDYGADSAAALAEYAASGWSDDFEGRTEAIGAGADYTLIGGTVDVTSGVARHTNAGINNATVQIDALAAQVVDGTWTIVHDNAASIGHEFMFRYVDTSNWLRVQFQAIGQITIDTLVAGSFTRHADIDRSADLSGGASETSIIEFTGSTINARWIGGTNVTSTRTEFLTETGKAWKIDGIGTGVDFLEMSIV